MSRILIIPDIHLQTDFAERALAHGLAEGAERVVLLGDLFDNTYDTPAQNAAMARWLMTTKQRLGERLVVLVGNHDLSYLEFLARNPEASERVRYRPKHRCSGFDVEKAEAIRDAVSPDFSSWWRLHHREDGVLFTHAGADAAQEPELESQWAEALASVRDPASPCHPLLACGAVRGGAAGTRPGVVWRDLSEFADETPVFQIFGHTQRRDEVRCTDTALCLDACQSAYAWIDDGRDLTVFSAHGCPIRLRHLPFDARYAASVRQHRRTDVRRMNRVVTLGSGLVLHGRITPPNGPFVLVTK